MEYKTNFAHEMNVEMKEEKKTSLSYQSKAWKCVRDWVGFSKVKTDKWEDAQQLFAPLTVSQDRLRNCL